MATVLAPCRSAAAFQCLRLAARTVPATLRRALSTLPQNRNIYAHRQGSSYTLSLLPASPPTPSLAVASCPSLPPVPDQVQPNPDFLKLVHHVIKLHAVDDPYVQAQAQTYASQAGSSLGSGGLFFPANHPSQRGQRQRQRQHGGGDGAGGASSQGGMGGAGRGGYIHVADQRHLPDFGRTAYPEDIFGSLEVDGEGSFVDGTGRYQEGGTYRLCTREGMLGLSPYLMGKVREKVEELDGVVRARGAV